MLGNYAVYTVEAHGPYYLCAGMHRFVLCRCAGDLFLASIMQLCRFVGGYLAAPSHDLVGIYRHFDRAGSLVMEYVEIVLCWPSVQ